MASRRRQVESNDWYTSQVYKDPDFISDIHKLESMEHESPLVVEKVNNFRANICQKYQINSYGIHVFQMGQLLRVEYEKSSCRLKFNHKDHKYYIELDDNATRAELLEQWGHFKRIHDFTNPPTKTKRKSPDNPSLLYAINKAKRTGLKDKAIFELYDNRKLPGFTKKPIYDTAKELFDYYRHYFR